MCDDYSVARIFRHREEMYRHFTISVGAWARVWTASALREFHPTRRHSPHAAKRAMAELAEGFLASQRSVTATATNPSTGKLVQLCQRARVLRDTVLWSVPVVLWVAIVPFMAHTTKTCQWVNTSKFLLEARVDSVDEGLDTRFVPPRRSFIARNEATPHNGALKEHKMPTRLTLILMSWLGCARTRPAQRSHTRAVGRLLFETVILASVDPKKALSKHQLKLVIRRGSYKESHERLSEIWECVIGIAPNVLGGKSGEEGAAEPCEQKMLVIYKACLRIGRELSMPPDWGKADAWWAVCIDGGARRLLNTRREDIVIKVAHVSVQACRDINDQRFIWELSEARATSWGRAALLARTCAEVPREYETPTRGAAEYAHGEVSFKARTSSRSEPKLAIEYADPAIEDDKPSGSTPKSSSKEPIASGARMSTMSFTKADLKKCFTAKQKQRPMPKAVAKRMPNARGRGSQSENGRTHVDETFVQPPSQNA